MENELQNNQNAEAQALNIPVVSNSFSLMENIFLITFEVGAVWSRTYQSAGKDINEALEKIFREYPDYKGCRYLHNEYEPRMVQIFS